VVNVSDDRNIAEIFLNHIHSLSKMKMPID